MTTPNVQTGPATYRRIQSTLSWRVMVTAGLVALVWTWSVPSVLAEPCPGTPTLEKCDAIDNDCDGSIDEGFGVGASCSVGDPPGCTQHCNIETTKTCGRNADCTTASDQCNFYPGGCCLTGGTRQCLPDGSGTFCEVVGSSKTWELEGALGPTDPNCFDNSDNDCDGLKDQQESACQRPEVCNGIDDDNNGTIDDPFTDLGDPCTVGVGGCQKNGIMVCNAAQSGTECSAQAGSSHTEGPFGSVSCSNAIDDDCDGLTDFPADPDCRLAQELCDGLDNTGDGVIDEGFPDLGTPCTVGTGVCKASGVMVCGADHTNTVCDAVPGLGSVEGPSGPTCADGLDNDCDGFLDMADTSCNAALLAVSCSLPLLPGRDATCKAIHTIQFDVHGASANAVVNAELLGLNAEGEVLTSAAVANGDRALLHSTDHGVGIHSGNDHFHRVRAPLQVLRVHVQDGAVGADAFCSPIPFVKTFGSGSCGLVSASAGSSQPVTVAVPGINPATLKVFVDGVDLLPAIGVNPAADFPGGPFAGTFPISGGTVTVSDLFMRVDSNVLTMNLDNVPCGGHLVTVKGEPLPSALPQGRNCFVDDYRDKCPLAVFGITVDSPTDQEITALVPTPVKGQVCHGRQITSLKINGRDIDTSNQKLMAGDGRNTADTFILPIDELIGQTDVKRDTTTGDTTVGTFDPGTNRLVLDATDELHNRTFASVVFAVGDVQKPGTLGPAGAAALVDAAMGPDVPPELRAKIGDALALAAAEVSNAFVVGISPSGIQKVFDAKCAEAGTKFFESAKKKLLEADPAPIHISIDCSCDLNPKPRVTSFDLVDPTAHVTCPVQFVDGKFVVTVNLPDIKFGFALQDSCEDDVWGVCVAESHIDVQGTNILSGINFVFQVTEEQLEKKPAPPCGNGVVDPLELCDPSAGPNGCAGDFTGGDQHCSVSTGTACTKDDNCPGGEKCVGDTKCSDKCNACLDPGIAGDPAFTKNDAGTGCIGADICSVFVFVFTFGQVTGVDIDVPDVPTATVGAEDADPVCLNDIKVDEQEIPAFGVDLKADIEDVKINAAGLTARLKGEFSIISPDLEVADTPGAYLSPADAPMPPVPGAGEAYFALADDTFNQLFASLKDSGALKTAFETSTASQCVATKLCGGGSNDGGSCSADADCGSSTCSGGPTPGVACTDNSQCGTDGKCRPGSCRRKSCSLRCNAASGMDHLKSCTDNTICGAGACVEAGQCNAASLRPGDKCTQNSDCPSGACVESCPGADTCEVGPLTVGSLFPSLDTDPKLRILQCILRRRSVRSDTRVLLHGRTDVEPRLTIADTPATTPVETTLRLNDLSVEVIVDREANGIDNPTPGTAPSCWTQGQDVVKDFTTGQQLKLLAAGCPDTGLNSGLIKVPDLVPVSGDCAGMAMCLDLNFPTQMEFQTCSDGKPGIVSIVQPVQIPRREVGAVCGVAVMGTPDSEATKAGLESNTIDVLQNTATDSTPPLCTEGLNLGGFAKFSNPRLMAIEQDGNLEFQDYLAITGDLTPDPAGESPCNP